MRNILVLLLLVLTTACATQPAGGQKTASGPTLAEAREHPDAANGKAVRWGGVIVEVHNEPARTRIEIVARPLDARGRPRDVDRSDGRFVAYVDGFLDPVVYASGREITIDGSIAGVEDGRIGEYPYRFVAVEARSHRLWKPRQPVEVRYLPDPLYRWHLDPWGRPYPPWWW